MYSVLDFVYCNPNIKGKQQKKRKKLIFLIIRNKKFKSKSFTLNTLSNSTITTNFRFT